MSTLTIPVTDADHHQGPASAPVTLVEYGDYQCPYCGAAHPIVKAVQAALKGKLRFVFRNFPLTSIHEHAMLAAHAAEAAGAQSESLFWSMHDTLFENQNDLSRPALLAAAESLGLDISRFEKDLDSPPIHDRVQHDFRGGVRSGVNGTPSFFINGDRYDGDRDAESMIAALHNVHP
jgi:protein-disulfide isomerase